MGDGAEHGLSIPKNWPRHARPAVIHAMAMAHVAFAAARRRAEHQLDARARLQAENDRPAREVALLREELRIKDARMEKLPPQQRPHYPLNGLHSSIGVAGSTCAT